jgi:hypothetical protein
VNAIKDRSPAYDITGGLLAWTNGELEREGTIELFQALMDSGLAWQLEGHIGRCAQQLIDAGEVTRPAPKVHTFPDPGRLVCHDPAVQNIGSYVGVEYEAVIEFKLARRPSRRFHVFTYRAYNACGLVGHECNGIAVCDINKSQVLCDEIAKQSSGHRGVGELQINALRRLQASNWQGFRQAINNNPRARYSI